MDDDLDDVSLHTSPHALAPAPRRGNLLLWTAVPAALAGIFLLAHLLRPYGRPSKVVDKAIAALQAGDAAKLRTEESLGMKARAEREIRARGEAEYQRVLAIFAKEGVLGDREYRRIRRKLAELGDKEFRKLKKDEQKAIREASRRQFVADKGWAALSDEDRTLLGSPDVLGDRAKLRARAMTVGISVLSVEFQQAVAGVDLTAPEVAKDKTLGKLAAQAQKAGLEELKSAIDAAEGAAGTELMRMPRREREKLEATSYARWVLEAGLKATDDKTRAKASLAQLLDDDAPEAWALRRSFGAKDLDAESRAAIEKLDYDKITVYPGRRLFVDEQGTRLWGDKLKETFNPDCCKATTVRYLGESGRSLLRNATATVALEFGPPPPKPAKPKAKAEAAPVADKPDDKADKKDDKSAEKSPEDKKADELDDPIHPARRYLGQTVVLEYRWGSWAIASFDAGSEDEPARKHGADEAMKAALGALSTLKGGGLSGFVLFAVFGGLLLMLVVTKRKSGVALAPIELAVGGITLGLATLQIASEGQATLDDLWFTPLYLALPVWIGARRGTESGLVAGSLAGLALVVASAVAGVPTWASAGGDALPLGEHLLAALVLATSGALAGRLRSPTELALALPLLWLLFFAAIDRSQLASFTLYAHLFAACAITGLGFLAHQLGLVQQLGRVTSTEPLES